MSANGKAVHLNKDYVAEIQLKDVLYHFVYRWKSILLVTVLCAAVLAGWQYLSTKRLHDAGGKTKDEMNYEVNLASYQAQLAQAQADVSRYQGWLDEKTAYRDGVLLLQLDPNDVWVAERKYVITECTAVQTAYVVAAYVGAMTADHDEAALQEAFGTTNMGYVSDMVTLSAVSGESSFTVSVMGPSKEAAEKGLAYVAQKVTEIGPKAQEICPHTLHLAAEGTSRKAMPELTDKKNKLNSDVKSYENAVTSMKKTLNEVLSKGEPAKPGSPLKKWGIIGAVLGFAAMIALYLATFVMHSKVRRSTELSDQYGVPVFGETNKSCARKPGKGFNKVLEKFEFRKDPKTDDQVFDNAAVLIREKKADGPVLLTGTVKEETLARLKDALAERLGGDAELEVKANFPVDSGAVEDACRAGSVVWVEERHVSRCDKVQRAAEVLEAADANVIGAILV